MKQGIHPEYNTIKVTCSCGNSFETRSTAGRDLHLDVCSKCHPFYTGKQKMVDTAGRVDRFQQKYGKGRTKLKTTEKNPAEDKPQEDKKS